MAEDDQLLLIDTSPEELEPAGAEGEEDLSGLDPKTISEAVVYATDWTAETILRQLERGNIHMNPKYQRRDAWRAGVKSRFIESLILSIPVPPLVLAEAKGKRGSYIVIDGKQRLLTIRQFAASANDADYEQLRLRGLEIRKDLNGYSMADLEEEPTHQNDLAAFQNQTIRTVVLRNWPNESFLHLVFLRLNTGTVPLSPQELRQALRPGPFVDYAIEYSGSSIGLRRLFKSDKPDFRMRDVELLVRFYAFRNFLDLYDGNLKSFLDYTCSAFNETWNKDEGKLQGEAQEFEEALAATFDIFGDNACRKSDGVRYEKRLNRAVFDVMLYYFSQAGVRKAAVENSLVIEAAFRTVCGDNPDFRRAIETTTKSVLATQTRLSIWGQELNRVLGIQTMMPRVGSLGHA